MQDFETSIGNIKTRHDAEQIAGSLMAQTTTAQHATEMMQSGLKQKKGF